MHLSNQRLASHESGGRLNETIDRIAQSVREMQRLKRKIESDTAMPRKSAILRSRASNATRASRIREPSSQGTAARWTASTDSYLPRQSCTILRFSNTPGAPAQGACAVIPTEREDDV